nr:hypothetical protein BaRGS_002347 [Batillaria attramentaria]
MWLLIVPRGFSPLDTFADSDSPQLTVFGCTFPSAGVDVGQLHVAFADIFKAELWSSESVREVRKYSEPMEAEDLKHHPEAETLYHMKLFRAQRNLYIAGFALFLWL